MSSESRSPTPEEIRLNQQLETLRGRVVNTGAAKKLWFDLLNDAERRRLGDDLQVAYQRGGIVGMWMRLREVDQLRALLDLGHHLGFLDVPSYQSLLDQCGFKTKTADPLQVPIWDREARELRFRKKVIRRVRQPAQAVNVVMVLDAFQEQHWPARIDDPLPGGQNQQRLHATIRSLNNGLKGIVFQADGTGQGYMWRKA